MRKADSLDRVPVSTARGEPGNRSTGGDAEQPLIRVEGIKQRMKVGLVGTASVEQNQCTQRFAPGLSKEVGEVVERLRHRA